MKTLILIRHGKSSWKYPVKDIDRPLKSRGKTDALLVVNEFLRYHISPDLVVSSPAKRAIDICRIFMLKLNILHEILQINPTIYDFNGSPTADFIKSLDNNYQKVMLFGHNYAFTALANLFGSRYIENLPTSGLVVINFNVDKWQDISKGTTELIIFPKDLR